MTLYLTWAKKRARRSEKRALPTLKARFVDEYWRYAEVDDKIYPVLLLSCASERGDYSEKTEECEPSESDEDEQWYADFVSALRTLKTAVMVKVISDNDYRFEYLVRIERPMRTNTLNCYIGEKLARLKPG